MCRLLAYLGEDILLSSLLLTPQHSLEKQAWQPRELREAKLNADGFGFAWYNKVQNHHIPAHYRQVLPIWNDPNLLDLANTLKKPLWIAAVRSATPGLGISFENTQPFLHNNWAFLHNGYLLDFFGETQHKLRAELSDEFLFLIKGNTDSEYIFALLMQLLAQHEPQQALRNCIETIENILGDKRALLNIVLTDGEKIYATRCAVNGLCPSLYYTNNNEEFGIGNQLLASEKLNDSAHWKSIREQALILIDNNNDIEILDL